MPAVPAIIGVAGAIISAKVASNANKASINANKETTTQALDYEKTRNADKQARYDKAMEQWRSDRNAYYKKFYGWDPDEGKAPATAAPAKATPITTGGTYAPGYGPTPAVAPQVTTQGGRGMVQPLSPQTTQGGPMVQDVYRQEPRGISLGENPVVRPPAPSIGQMGDWSDWSKLGLGQQGGY